MYRVEQTYISRYDVARREQYDVARYEHGRWHRYFRAVTPHLRKRLRERAKRRHGTISAIPLSEAEHRVQDHDRDDGDHVLGFAHESGDERGHEQHDDHRVGELRGQHP